MNNFQNTDKAKRMFGNDAPNGATSSADTRNFKNKQPNSAIPAQGSDNADNNKNKQKEARQKAKERAEKAQQKASDAKDALSPTIGSKIKLAAKKVGRGAQKTGRAVKKIGQKAGQIGDDGEEDGLFGPSKVVVSVAIGAFFLVYIITYWEQRFVPDILFNHMDNQMHNEEYLKDQSDYEESPNLVRFQEGYEGEEVIDDHNNTSLLYNGGDAYVGGTEKKDEND